jgi:hypothetical protein
MADRPVVKEIRFQGILIAVEYEYGSIHQKTTDDGPITHVFGMDYGFFPGAILSPDSGLPSDGEPLDAMVSQDDPDAPMAYVLLQKKHGKNPAQLKVVLGTNEDGAVALFLKHRPEKLFGGIYGSLSVTSLRSVLDDWKGTLPLEKKRMRLPTNPHEMNRGIIHMLADASLTTDMLSPVARRGFDAVRAAETTMEGVRVAGVGDEWLRKHKAAPWTPSGHLRKIDEKSRQIDFVSSTSAIDRYGSIIEQNWRLKNYLNNPIVPWCHNCDGLPVAMTLPESFRTDKIGADDCLLSTVQVVTVKENPTAEWVLQCYISGALRAISVRFDPEGYKWEEVAGQSIIRYTNPELIEQSLCTVPGNAATLAIRELQSRMLQALERTAQVIAPARAFSIPSPTTPADPAVRTNDTETTMRLTCKARDASVTHLLRHGVLEENCPGCKAELSIQIDTARDLESRVQQSAVETADAKRIASDTEKRLSEVMARANVDAAKIADLERKLETLGKDLETKTTEAAIARKDANAATKRTAEIELSLIVGPGNHEITPVEQRELAELAVSNPDRYSTLRDEKFSKYQRTTGFDPAKALLSAGSTPPGGGQRGVPPAGAPPIGPDQTPSWLPPNQRDAGGFGQTAGAAPPAPPAPPPNGGSFAQMHAQLHGGNNNASDNGSLYDKISIS